LHDIIFLALYTVKMTYEFDYYLISRWWPSPDFNAIATRSFTVYYLTLLYDISNDVEDQRNQFVFRCCAPETTINCSYPSANPHVHWLRAHIFWSLRLFGFTGSSDLHFNSRRSPVRDRLTSRFFLAIHKLLDPRARFPTC